MSYAEVNYEPKASEMSRNISCEMSTISILSYLGEMRTRSRALDNSCEISRNISRCMYGKNRKYIKYWIFLILDHLG